MFSDVLQSLVVEEVYMSLSIQLRFEQRKASVSERPCGICFWVEGCWDFPDPMFSHMCPELVTQKLPAVIGDFSVPFVHTSLGEKEPVFSSRTSSCSGSSSRHWS